MKLTLGLSPCPNDTFIFDALIHHKIDTEGLTFEVIFEDVETLNQKAFRTELAITKLSFYAYMHVLKNYVLLHAGSALGFGVGPLLISNTEFSLPDLHIQTNLRVGIPGKYTTANFLVSLALPQLQNKRELVFSSIDDALLRNEIDLGLIIHENRFTYQAKGLKKVIDLGEYWETLSACPIPLGGIVIKRSLSDLVQQKVNRVIRRSVEYAFKHPESSLAFVRSYAQEMSEAVLRQHIELYVNKYSIDLGSEGRTAVSTFFEKAVAQNMIPFAGQNLFCDLKSSISFI